MTTLFPTCIINTSTAITKCCQPTESTVILFQPTFMDVLDKSLYIVWTEGVTVGNFVMKIFSQGILLLDCLYFRVLPKPIPLILALHQVNLHALVQIG